MSNGDYENIVNFMDEMTKPMNEFRTHVLKTFENIFGFHYSNFWLTDDYINLVDPVRLNVEQHMMDDYLNGGFQWDYHIPTRIHQKLTRQRVLRLEDLIPLEQYEREPYYNEFMHRHGFYYQMAAFIINNGKLLGGIAFVKPESDKPFTLKDVTSLEIITRYLSEYMANYYKEKKLTEEKNFNQACISNKEREVIELVQKGLSNKEIAQTLYISIYTVKKHLQNIYKKLNVPNRTSLCYKLQVNRNSLLF